MVAVRERGHVACDARISALEAELSQFYDATGETDLSAALAAIQTAFDEADRLAGAQIDIQRLTDQISVLSAKRFFDQLP